MNGDDDSAFPDHRDLALEMFALSEAELLERVASLEADAGTYRELAVAGFDALQNLTARIRTLHAERDRLRDENSTLREHLLLKTGVDDKGRAAA